jgi:hypothetical protein
MFSVETSGVFTWKHSKTRGNYCSWDVGKTERCKFSILPSWEHWFSLLCGLGWLASRRWHRGRPAWSHTSYILLYLFCSLYLDFKVQPFCYNFSPGHKLWEKSFTRILQFPHWTFHWVQLRFGRRLLWRWYLPCECLWIPAPWTG